MFNRKIENGPRSEYFFRAAVGRALHFENNALYPAVDTKSLDLAYLFAEEERLAAEIGDDKLTFDKSQIYRTVTLAKKITKAGYPLQMVSLDEMLDIAQTFCLRNHHDVDTTDTLLTRILANLEDSGNSAWTARVAATLAYFSKLED